ncbi:MAG: TIGR02757 family protein [Bacteroidota bacterium]
MNTEELLLIKEFLESEHDRFNRPDFICNDPISIPHKFSKKEDREIAGFLTATISWGQRITILKNANWLMELMDGNPYAFLLQLKPRDLDRFEGFVHRTFNDVDCVYFIKCLSRLYVYEDGLHGLFRKSFLDSDMDFGMAIHRFRSGFFGKNLPGRSAKHFSDPMSNAAAKRICMYLRWMVRKDNRGVDFGIWNDIPTSLLVCPLDVHSGRVARELGILHRKQNDWKAAIELTESLRYFDPKDPCRFDYSLFGGGVSER